MQRTALSTKETPASANAMSWSPLLKRSAPVLQRKCACGGTPGSTGGYEECRKGRLQRKVGNSDLGTRNDSVVPPIVHEVLRSPGQSLDAETRAFMEPRFGHEFSRVRVHTDAKAADSARAVNALAYTVGRDIVFGAGHYAPDKSEGRGLVAHELAHVLQQSGTHSTGASLRCSNESAPEEQSADLAATAVLLGRPFAGVGHSPPMVQRRAAPYIKKVSVHLTPPQSADLEWEGTLPSGAPGSDHFTVSTGKGYSDPGDPQGTCTRDCCSDPATQCAPPYNQPGRVGACCTYYGSSFWTGTPEPEHGAGGWKFWTPIQPYYSSRGIALHQHTEVTGQPIGHGCVRMEEDNAHRIAEFSNGRQTNVTIDGRAAPVLCEADRMCPGSKPGTGGSRGASLEEPRAGTEQLATSGPAVAGLEGEMS
jgi:hypothetical protein